MTYVSGYENNMISNEMYTIYLGVLTSLKYMTRRDKMSIVEIKAGENALLFIFKDCIVPIVFQRLLCSG